MSYSDYALIKKSTLTEIGDAIRSQKGTTELIDPSNMKDEILSISGSSPGGSSGSSNPTLENGYTVNFYNHDKSLIEIHSALCSMNINPPESYDADAWINEGGSQIAFPYTVSDNSSTRVYNFYASGALTCTQQLYAHFGVDVSVYPIVVIGFNTGDSGYPGVYVMFGKRYEFTWGSSRRWMALYDCLTLSKVLQNPPEANYANSLKVTQYVMSNCSASDLTTSSPIIQIPAGTTGYSWGYYIHTNDDSLANTTYEQYYGYDLDKTTYTP